MKQGSNGKRIRRAVGGTMWFNDDDRASWAFVEGSISVSASILIAYAIAKCDRCGAWPVIGFFKNLTEQDSGILIAGMALLFPTAFIFYLGVKMVFAAYRDYKRWREEQVQRMAAAREEAREKGRVEGREAGRAEGREAGRAEGRAEGSAAERLRIKRELTERGLSLDPEIERILSGESDDNCS